MTTGAAGPPARREPAEGSPAVQAAFAELRRHLAPDAAGRARMWRAILRGLRR